jgi:cysteine desulfurase
MGIQNKPEDIDHVLKVMPPIVERLREMSPVYAKFLKVTKGGQ